MDSSEAKAELRQLLRAARHRIDPAARRVASAAAVQHLRSSGFLDGAQVVAVFAAFRAEIDPVELEADFETVYPRVEPEGLVFVPARRAVLKPRTMGILEPVGAPIDVLSIDVFVVPGLAFTRAGDRLGYGAGYYDRALSGATGQTVGIGYDQQMVDELPVEPHDVRLDAVVTESGFFDTRNSR